MSIEEARRPKCGVKWFLLVLIFLCLIIDGYRMDLDIHHWDRVCVSCLCGMHGWAWLVELALALALGIQYSE